MTVSRLNEVRRQATQRFAERLERLEAQVIDEPAGGEPRTRKQRVMDFVAGRHDPEYWRRWIEQEQTRHSLDPWDRPRTVITFAQARLREIRQLEESD